MKPSSMANRDRSCGWIQSIHVNGQVSRYRVGGGHISGAMGMRTGGPGSYAKNSELIRKAHLGTTSDTRLFSGEKRTSHFKRVKSVQTRSSHGQQQRRGLTAYKKCRSISSSRRTDCCS